MTQVNKDKLKAQLSGEEGVKKFPYIDSRGILTGGIGRNLKDVGFRSDEIDLMFDNDEAIDDFIRFQNNCPKSLERESVVG